MDQQKIALLLKGTLDPAHQAEAEKQLNEVQKIIGFAPGLLQVVMAVDCEMPVRQAGAVYLKNTVITNWEDKEPALPGGLAPFNIHEQDRAQIRAALVDALVIAPPVIQVHLGVCVNHIVKTDFPEKFSPVVDKMSVYLSSSDPNQWLGALIALHQIVKYYEYKSVADRLPMIELMQLFLPLLYQRQVQLLPETSNESLLLQKQILKIFYTLIQYNMPLTLLTREVFTQWMQIVCTVIDRPLPEQCLKPDLDKDDLPEQPAWKCKKWATHIVCRIFDRFGQPGNVHKEYKEFADWYIKTFSEGILGALLKTISLVMTNQYVAPRVVQQSLNYLNTSVSHAATWKLIKPHFDQLLEKAIFPLLCHNAEDDEMWADDPIEYIKVKFDVFEDYVSPKVAAQGFVHSACKKRKDVLPKCLNFAVTILNAAASTTARQKDGAIALVGSVADILLKKEAYKSNLETMLVSLVYPLFASPDGFLRARACWVMRHFAETRFLDDANLVNGFQAVLKCLLHEQELPVRVEAAVCLQSLISEQEKVQKLMESHCKDVTVTLLEIIRETENDDLANVMQKLVYLYSDQLAPIALEITTHLASTLSSLVTASAGEGDEDEHGMAAISVMNTIDSVLVMMEDNQEIMLKLEPIITQIVAHIFQSDAVDLYEEAFNLVGSMTSKFIPPTMWKVYEMIYQLFKKDRDNMDYFGDMMPSLHNFVTIGSAEFLADRARLAAMFDMCSDVMKNDELSEDMHSYAAKLLEVLILTFKGQIDDAVPSFLELTMNRLHRPIEDDELKTQCLAVLISSFYANPVLTCQVLHKLKPDGSLVTNFINQWISETDLFLGLHDRKMCVLGLTTLISLPPEQRNALIGSPELVQQIIPSCCLLFEKLKLAYEAKAAGEEDDDDDEEDEDGEAEEYDGLEADDDEDHRPDQIRLRYLQKEMNRRFPPPGQNSDNNHVTDEDIGDEGDTDGDDDDDEDEDDDEYDPDPGELTALESYNAFIVDGDDSRDAPVDEYITFRETLEGLQRTDPNFYNALFGRVDSSARKQLEEVFTLAGQRQNARESKKIQQAGGYNFQLGNVPTTFNFGGAAPAPGGVPGVPGAPPGAGFPPAQPH